MVCEFSKLFRTLAQVVLIYMCRLKIYCLTGRRWSMLKETAKVVSTSHGRAKVAITRSEACGNCPAKSMCSTASGNINVLEVRNSVEARAGQTVIIELQPETLVKATAMVYLLPAVAMVTGTTVGWLKTGSDPGAMIGALVGLIAASCFLFWHGRREKPAKGPTISKVLSPSGIGHIGHSHETAGYPFDW
jgi:sigma-E factor negative regulatory protein RseC